MIQMGPRIFSLGGYRNQRRSCLTDDDMASTLPPTFCLEGALSTGDSHVRVIAHV